MVVVMMMVMTTMMVMVMMTACVLAPFRLISRCIFMCEWVENKAQEAVIAGSLILFNYI
jgi:hypothetical protein